MRKILSLVALSMFSTGVLADRTYINPMDLEYQYGERIPERRQFIKAEGLVTRQSADPVVVSFEKDGKHQGYFLFASQGRGYWMSEDLVTWQHIKPTGEWPVSYFTPGSGSDPTTEKDPQTGLEWKDMIAPAALAKDSKIYLLSSNRKGGLTTLFVSDDPASGKWKVADEDLGFPVVGDRNLWDPALYHEDEQWYVYWGSSNLYPLWGAKINRNNKDGLYIDRFAKPLLAMHPDVHGWERMGFDHTSPQAPYVEGPEMLKHGDTYYLSYAGPGSDGNVYGDGVYIGKSPLGPFTYQEHNPVTYKPGGYVHGAGHGNTFKDAFGNIWRSGSNWFGVNWVFERRNVILPSAIDDDGILYSTARFADFPQFAPTGKYSDPNDLFTGWMLLSYNKPAWATSELPPENGRTFYAGFVTNENPRNFWVAGKNNDAQHVVVDLQGDKTVNAVQINYADYMVAGEEYRAPLPRDNRIAEYKQRIYTHYRLLLSRDNKTWTEVSNNLDKQENRSNIYIELDEPVTARFVRFENVNVGVKHLALNGLRVFGSANDELPAMPEQVTVKRDTDRRNVYVAWQAVEGAVGYNVRFGIAPDKLYHTYQIWGDEFDGQKEIRSLDIHKGYYFAVEAFNETGVSKLSSPKMAK
ncbi:family 43 glycosylhydrolase [Photobacterium minamisatsumaniensis]|uniref:family 43 glycosylhydrolase n=1 Tax=Photobacterium minamisatsumaniensis TaxID=2910233 RepID=UPI003D13560B